MPPRYYRSSGGDLIRPSNHRGRCRIRTAMTTATLNTILDPGRGATMEASLTAVMANQSMLAEDLALVQRAAAGDVRAFEQLYRSHVDRIHGLCCRLCHGDTARAEQATQDAFVRAWEKLASFRGESRFGTWLHRLTVNVVLGEHRLLRRWVTFEDEVQAGADGSDGADGLDPIEPVRQEDIGARIDLERELARLPKGARTVLVLHDIEGYQHDEISDLTGIAVGTSKAQLHRARRLLRAWLQ